jgi:probable O-glycosylation ligase (exosortase A-associated)
MRAALFLIIFLTGLILTFVSPFYGVLLWYGFSLGNFHTLAWGALDNLYLAYIIAILIGVSWLLSRSEQKRLPMTPLVVLTLVFSLWMTITSYFALAPVEFVWERWVAVHKVLLMCLVGYALTTTRQRVDQLIWVVVFAVGFWGVKGSLSFLLHGGDAISGIHGPEAGVAADNNQLGIALIMILPLVFYQWHIATNRHLRNGLMAMGFLISLAIIFTYSRGALLGLVGMGAVFWLRSRAKIATGILIIVVGLFVYTFVPQYWFDRMATIETYDADPSASGRIDFWKISLRVAEVRPITGGGFWVTNFPDITNKMLEGTTLRRLTRPRATHSIWFDALSEHGWPGLALFVAIAGYSLYNCSWLIRHTRGRPDLDWANLLGRMGQSTLTGFWVSGSFASLAYFDEYWCVMFIFDSARRIAAREIAAQASAHPTPSAMGIVRGGVSPAVRAGADGRPGYATGRDFGLRGATRHGNV